MNDISELQARLATALERIGAGVAALETSGATADDSEEFASLQAQLEEERTTNAQLEERVRAIKEAQDLTLGKLTAEVERLSAQLSAAEETAARLAHANAELRDNNTALREAIAQGVAEPHLVNKAMMAELDALRATQSADRAELDSVLGELGAMIIKAEDAAQTEESTDA